MASAFVAEYDPRMILGTGTRIVARDIDGLTRFYENLVGLRRTIGDTDYSIFDSAGILELDGTADGTSEAATALIVFVDSVVEARRLLEVAGVGPTGIVDEGYRKRFQVVDPEGNVVQFVQDAVDFRGLSSASDGDATRPFLDHLGLRWSFIDGEAAVELELRSDLAGPGGSLQGGVTASLIDVAAATCASTALGVERVFTTTMTIHYLRRGEVGPIRATAAPLRVSHGAAVVEVRVVDVGASAEPIAVGLLAMQTRTQSRDDEGGAKS
jgi:uncharacterized protein (TIGR00369 family)